RKLCLKPLLLLAASSVWMEAASAAPDPATVYASFKADAGTVTNSAGTVTNWSNKAARVAVFVNGRNGYACYRIPAMVTTTRGTVIAVADGRVSGCGDIPNPLDLVARRSFDNGQTWASMQVIADYGSNPNDTDTYPYYGITTPAPRVAGGNAALLVDLTNNRVWVLYDNGGAAVGQPYNRAIKLEMRFSDDD